MRYSLNSLKGVMLGDYARVSLGDIEADTGSLDYGSYDLLQGRFRKLGVPGL